MGVFIEDKFQNDLFYATCQQFVTRQSRSPHFRSLVSKLISDVGKNKNTTLIILIVLTVLNVQCKRDWCVERCNLRSRKLAPSPEVLRVST